MGVGCVSQTVGCTFKGQPQSLNLDPRTFKVKGLGGCSVL